MTRERYLTDAELERFMAAVRTRRHEHVAPETIRAAMEATTTEALVETRSRNFPEPLRPSKPY